MTHLQESDTAGRDLLAELHEEECAHGATLMRLGRLRDALDDIAGADSLTDAKIIAANALKGSPWR